MAIELFKVYLKEDGNLNVELNEEVIEMYGMTLEEFSNKFKTENLYKGIQDFTKALENNK